MSFFPREQVRRAFDTAAARLDAALARAVPALTAAGLTVEDCSNRTGLDRMFNTDYRWEHRLSRRTRESGCIVEASIDWVYVEPSTAEQRAVVRWRILAQVFSPGQPSWFRWTDERSMDVAACEAPDVASTLLMTLRGAAERLPEPYRARWFESAPAGAADGSRGGAT